MAYKDMLKKMFVQLLENLENSFPVNTFIIIIYRISPFHVKKIIIRLFLSEKKINYNILTYQFPL